MSNIQDKVVIITGASSGIGEATAKELHLIVQSLYWRFVTRTDLRN
jgi:NADP-dependent 3-hydroxy acid dehydrogenase YdfG